MADGFIPADSFELAGAAAISYDLRSRRLHYRGPTRPPLRDFVEVSETATPLDTPIGRLVTATLRAVADGDTSTVTVLLPDVNLARTGDRGGVAEATFETVAVFTTSRSTRGGPGRVEGPLQLYTLAPLKGTARRARPTSACVFSAVLSRGLPGPEAGPGLLRVDCQCTFPTTGYKVDLVRHEPQGSDPLDLLLDLRVTPPPPDAVVAPTLTKYPVSYEEETTVEVRTATILPDGPSIDVEIIT